MVKRRRKLRVGLVRMARTVWKRAVALEIRPFRSGWREEVGISGAAASASSFDEGDLILRWLSLGFGRRAVMTGMPKISRTMPTQSGSQSIVLMAADARAGPSWREKMEETAFT
jgi:hypothetical protein